MPRTKLSSAENIRIDSLLHYIRQCSSIIKVLEICKSKGLTPYLFGRAVRNCLLDTKNDAEFDVLLLNNSSNTIAIQDSFNVEYGRELPSFNFHEHHDINVKLKELELTVDALALNLFDGSLSFGHDRTLSDLRNKIARPTNSSLFLSSPPAALRAINFTYQFQFSFSEELKNSILAFPQAVRLGDEQTQCLVFSEFLKLTSSVSAIDALYSLLHFGLIHQILPEIVPALAQFPAKVSLLQRVEKLTKSLPPAVQSELFADEEHVLFPSSEDIGSSKQRLRFNEICLIRMCCLFDDLAESYRSLDPSPRQNKEDPELHQRSISNFLLSAQRRVEASNYLVEFLQEVRTILLSTLRLTTSSNVSLSRELTTHARPHCFLIYAIAKLSETNQHPDLQQELLHVLSHIDVE